MFRKEIDILHEIAELFSKEPEIIRAYVYGSRVRGDYRGDSDIDVLVVVNKKNKYIKNKIIEIFYSYELKTDMSFSIVILSTEELEFNQKLGSPFIKSINTEGVIFYDSKHRGKESPVEVSSR